MVHNFVFEFYLIEITRKRILTRNHKISILSNNRSVLQYFHSDPVLKLRVRSEPLGSLGNDSSEDLCLIYPKAIARIDAIDLKVGLPKRLSCTWWIFAISLSSFGLHGWLLFLPLIC